MRLDDCSQYSTCLLGAARANLRDFSCTGCGRYDKAIESVPWRVWASPEHTYPPSPEHKGSINELSSILSKSMRKNGIPLRGFREEPLYLGPHGSGRKITSNQGVSPVKTSSKAGPVGSRLK